LPWAPLPLPLGADETVDSDVFQRSSNVDAPPDDLGFGAAADAIVVVDGVEVVAV
jgi:hypothetical protein